MGNICCSIEQKNNDTEEEQEDAFKKHDSELQKIIDQEQEEDEKKQVIRSRYNQFDVISQQEAEKESPRNTYMFYNSMDDNNKKAMDIFQNEGTDAAVKHMTTNSDGKPRSYAEMRSLYG